MDRILSTPEDFKAKKVRKGRSEELNRRRDDVFLIRFWYYANKTNFQYQAIIEQLSREFFIAPRRISDLIGRHHKKLKELDISKISNSELGKLAPLYKW